ncbi:MAG: hypothetical protein ACKODS_00090, partial [Methylophilaceae bacterium]
LAAVAALYSPDPSYASANIPPPASVVDFNALIGSGSADANSPGRTVGVLGDIFGSSAQAAGEVPEDTAPLLRIPGEFHYSKGTFNALDQLFPSLPNSVPSPMELFTAQVQISQIQLAWQLTGKMIGTSVQGFNTLVNSQV